MVLIILVSLLVLGIAFYQIIQGLFGAMIMTILTVLAAAIAFNFYEPLGDLLVARLGAYAHPAALLALFVIPLFVLRELFDRVIRGNVVLGMWVSRIGGAVFGLFTALLLGGVLMLVLEMLPFGGSFLTFQPYDGRLAVQQAGPARWATDLTLGLMKHLSANSLRPLTDGNAFGRAHENLAREAFCLRNRPPGGRADAPPDSLEVTEAYVLEEPEGLEAGKVAPELRQAIARIVEQVPHDPLLTHLENTAGSKVVVVRAVVDESARDAAPDNWWRLPASHFRLVTRQGRSLYPVGYLTYSGGQWRFQTEESGEAPKTARIADICVQRQWFAQGGPKKLVVDWVYRLPRREDPQFLVFRRSAKRAMPPALLAGLPKPRDASRQIALGVMPQKLKVTFAEPGQGWLLEPVEMQVTPDLPTELRLLFKKDLLPPTVRLEEEAGRVRRASFAQTLDELRKLGGEIDRNSLRLNEFACGANELVVQVTFRLRADRAGDRDVAAQARRMNPQLLLDDARRIAHAGAYLLAGAGDERRAWLYYDARRAPGPVEESLVQALLASARDSDALFHLVFVVPDDRDRRIEALTIVPASAGQPAVDFFPKAPLACSAR